VTGDPYRDGAVPACPRCGELLGAEHACGEWIPAASLAGIPLAELGKFDQVKPLRAEPIPAMCPACHQEMEPRFWSDALFDLCTHGIWVDAEHRKHFHARLAIVHDQNRQLDELAERMETIEGRREFARRLLALERRVARMEVR
jgi:hypothetical protein